jgi:hypothetical protein
MIEEPIPTHLDALDQDGTPLAVDIVGAKGLLSSTDADGVPWVGWHNERSIHFLKLQGRQWASVGDPIRGIDARSLCFTHVANDPVVAWMRDHFGGLIADFKVDLAALETSEAAASAAVLQGAPKA